MFENGLMLAVSRTQRSQFQSKLHYFFDFVWISLSRMQLVRIIMKTWLEISYVFFFSHVCESIQLNDWHGSIRFIYNKFKRWADALLKVAGNDFVSVATTKKKRIISLGICIVVSMLKYRLYSKRHAENLFTQKFNEHLTKFTI